MKGVICSINNNFGFIRVEGGEEYFFHRTAVDTSDIGTRFEELQVGDKVSFKEGLGPKGPRAESVTPV